MLTPGRILEFFKQDGELVTFKKRSIIVSRHDPLDYAYIITKGYVKVYDVDTTGEERIISVFAPGHVFPITWMLQSSDKETLYHYAAMSPVECYRVPIAKLEGIFSQPDICRFIMEVLIKAYVNHASRIQNLESSHAAERIKFILYYLAKRLGTTKHGIASLPLIITHQEIADLTGVARETVTIELRRLGQQGIYRRSQGVMYIDLDKLGAKDMPKVYGLQFIRP